MLLAQLHHKVPSEFEGMEDVLTSSAFALLKYLPEHLSCNLLARWADVPLGQSSPELEFWPQYPTPPGFPRPGEAAEREELAARGDTEPDVVIRTRDWLVLVEVKYRSPLDDAYDQLGREFAIGYQLAKRETRHFRMLVVTAHTLPPMPAGVELATGLEQALVAASRRSDSIMEAMLRSVPDSLRWKSWYQLYVALAQALDATDVAEHNRQLVEDVCQLLGLRGLKPYDSRPLIDIVDRWNRAGILDETWRVPLTYRYRTNYSLSAGWKTLASLDMAGLQPLAWQLKLPLSSYGLSRRLQEFQLDLLRSPVWRPYQ